MTLYTWLLVYPPFGIWGSLTFDIVISLYTITPFFFFLSYTLFYFTLQVHPRAIETENPCPHPSLEFNGCNAGLRMGVYSTRCHIFATTGERENAQPYILWMEVQWIIHSFEPRDLRKTSNYSMLKLFKQPLHHGNDQLRMAPLLLWCRPNIPPELNLWIYNIWNGRGFGLTQAIRAVQLWKCVIMLLTETNIPDEVYWKNRNRYDLVCLRAIATTTGGAQGWSSTIRW